uniref:Mitochondrial antiviral-signaling protein n=1 Tax=Oncorhynchus mykiss TaxID=8022 RepID=D7F7X2_ONCMY|nr:mitochondria antiviral signalling protein [Oncorhynchus mykiss]
MSSFTRDKLSLHLRRRMGVFVSRVKATELMANLPCLTLSDKEEIQAKKDFSGNYAAMQLLLDYVQKRMNWPEELMSALELLEHQDLADELRAEWNKHNQNNPYPPSAAATTAVRTHVQPIPSTSSEGSPGSLVLPGQPAPPEVTEDEQHTEPSQSQHFATAPADTSMNEDDVHFSKPEVLRSEVMDSQPYSGDSTRLQRSVSDLVLATADVNSPVVIPDPVTTSTPLPCQENGVPEEIIEPLSHNEPQEDTYESPCLSSLGDQEVLFNVVHVSKDASIQNNDGQTPSMLGIVVHMSEEPSIWNQDD